MGMSIDMVCSREGVLNTISGQGNLSPRSTPNPSAGGEMERQAEVF